MSSTAYNRTSSYNRTYEKRVIEETTPRVRSAHTVHVNNTGSIPHFSTTNYQSPTTTSSTTNHEVGMGFVTFHEQTQNSFHVQMDFSQFKIEEIKVSVIGQFIVVEAKHPAREDEYGFIERCIIRKFRMPPNVPNDGVTSSLTSDGQLTVTATTPHKQDDGVERTIPIKIVPNAKKSDTCEEKKFQGSSSQEQAQQ